MLVCLLQRSVQVRGPPTMFLGNNHLSSLACPTHALLGSATIAIERLIFFCTSVVANGLHQQLRTLLKSSRLWLHKISEPGVAAFYALTALDPHSRKIDDTFMLYDAGWGTVDLITYKVSSLKLVLNLVEVSPGSGSECGAPFLDRNFEEFLDKKLGNEVLKEVMPSEVPF